ncbi:MAG TPA: sigma-70 family RNA polymerase sigma factor [Terriglobia bacterium]|nr:sigma-70 family RNA polymerase sigma factor [Terriglobia bacterium]
MVGTAPGMVSEMSQKPQAAPNREAAGHQMAPSFEELYLEHYSRIIAVLVRLLGDPTQAEELTNDVFWRLYRQRLSLTPDGNVGGWLYRTATNLGIDALRSAARRRQYEHAAGELRAQAGSGSSPLDEVLREEKRSRVRAVLARLKPNQAQILVLRASGFSYKELAETLSVAGGSVGTMLARAEAAFAEAYREACGHEEGL